MIFTRFYRENQTARNQTGLEMGRFRPLSRYLDATKVEPQAFGCTAHHSADTSLCLEPAGEPHPKAPLPGPGLPPPTLPVLSPLPSLAMARAQPRCVSPFPWDSGSGRAVQGLGPWPVGTGGALTFRRPGFPGRHGRRCPGCCPLCQELGWVRGPCEWAVGGHGGGAVGKMGEKAERVMNGLG